MKFKGFEKRTSGDARLLEKQNRKSNEYGSFCKKSNGFIPKESR